MSKGWRIQAAVLAVLATVVFDYGVVTGNWWTTLSSGTCAVFFTLGSTDVGRHRESVRREYEIEGEVVSELIRRSFRAALLAIARPVVSVTEPASVLAFRRKDGKVYVVVQEASFPDTKGPVDVVLSLHGPGAHKATISSPKPFAELSKRPGLRRVLLHVVPDEVVPLVVDGLTD